MNKDEISKVYEQIYHTMPAYIASSPARINLIGEHIDYNGGHVLPACITLYTYGAIKLNNSKTIRLYSKAIDSIIYERSLDDLAIKDKSSWINYPIGIVDTLIKKGYLINQGFDIYFDSNIPLASGLSSSASILDLTVFLLCKAFSINLTKKDIALLAVSSERSYNGLSCGIMDEAIIALGKEKTALLLDTNTFKYEYIPLLLNDYVIAILKTNYQRKLTESKYNERVIECNTALNKLKAYYNIDNLAMLNVNDLSKVKELLNDDTLFKRVSHVVKEEQRVKDFVKALKDNNLEECGRLLNESHESLKNDYMVTGDALDSITFHARNHHACLGARMTGAGFGGCGIAIVKANCFDEFRKDVLASYFNDCKINGDIILSTITKGVDLF